ncbi:MAG: hypothetical protein WD468_03850, partial [Pirellulales bacterium]
GRVQGDFGGGLRANAQREVLADHFAPVPCQAKPDLQFASDVGMGIIKRQTFRHTAVAAGVGRNW